MKTLKVAYKEPEFMKPDEASGLSGHWKSARMPRALCRLSCCLSSAECDKEEIKRLIDSRKDIDLDAETVRISMPKGWTQGIAPRIFQLQPNALAWLMRYDIACPLQVACGLPKDHCGGCGAGRKVKMGRNIGRHSFITYHAAKFPKPDLNRHDNRHVEENAGGALSGWRTRRTRKGTSRSRRPFNRLRKTEHPWIMYFLLFLL